MKGFRALARDTALLTASALLMRCIALAYQVWLSGRIGAAGIGLWQLILSVSALSATLAISGIRFTTTRLVSEEIGRGLPGSAGKAVGHCLVYALLFGTAAGGLLFVGAEPIGFLWIGDARTVLSLRILAATLPMIALSSVLNGWFIASGRAWISAAVQVLEQILGIVCVMMLLNRADSDDLSLCCAAIARGALAADAASLLMISVLYLLDAPRRAGGETSEHLSGRMLRIAVPLAFSAYARTGLTTLEHLLVPRKLRSAGFSPEKSLTDYGTVTGMVFPILGFSSCLLAAVAELIVPALTAAQVQGDQARIRRTVSALLLAAAAYSISIGLILFLFGETLGRLIYHSPDAGRYLRILAPLVPVMYLDIITDGCLKGLGQMMRSMCYNIAEAMLGVALVVVLLPRYALGGYLFVLYFCEIFNFTMSITRLHRVVPFCFSSRFKRKKVTAY